MRIALPLLLLLCFGPVLTARAEDRPAAPKGPALPRGAQAGIRKLVAGWLADLKAAGYEVREAARRNLRARGLEARDLLEAARDDPDPEVRRTVRAVLARAPGRTNEAPVSVKPGEFRGLGLITLHADDEALSSVLERLGKAIHGTLEPPEDLRSKKVNLDLARVPCFDAIHMLARLTKTRPQRPFDRAGKMMLVAADPAVVPGPRGAAGPMQMTLVEVAATRSFGTATLPHYALKLRLEWSPLVQVRQYDRPRVEVARDPDGKRYRGTAAMARNASYGVGSSVKQHLTTVYLEPAEADCALRLGALEVSVPMHLQHDPAWVELRDLTKAPTCLGTDGKVAKAGTDESVQFHSVEEVAGTRGQWVVDFTATLLVEAARRSLQAFLVEEDGTLRQVSVYGGRSIGADGTVRITARTWRGTRGKPRGLRVTWFRREEEGSLRFRLENIPLR